MKFIRSQKVRALLNQDQESIGQQSFGARRWIWNYMLELQKKRYENGEKYLSKFDMIRVLTGVKKENAWLYDVSNAMLQCTCGDLNEAYQNFFKKRAGFPKFKSRRNSKLSFPIRDLYFKDGMAIIPKLGKVAIQTNYEIPEGKGYKFTNPRMSYVNGKWILSFGIEFESQEQDLTDEVMGIDWGIKELCTVAIGDKCLTFHNINKSKRVQKLVHKLKYLQRKAARKYVKGQPNSKSLTETYKQIAEIYYRISNMRHNSLHQTTHALVSLLPKKVIMEDINASGMAKNHKIARSAQEASFYEFKRQMQYKCEWNGIEFSQVPRFYPSSQICSDCGSRKPMPLHVRTYKCENCGLEIDRDYNAALNLQKYIA